MLRSFEIHLYFHFMKYRICFSIVSCLLLFSCSMEKQLYSSGYHLEWFHRQSATSEIQNHHQEFSNAEFSISNYSELAPSVEVNSTAKNKTLESSRDTLIPDNTNSIEEDYVSPNSIHTQNTEAINSEELRLTQKQESKLSRLSQYLVSSAIATLIPGVAVLYPILLIINIFIIRKIRSMAELSPYKNFYLNQIRRYWKIMLWPLYVILLVSYIFLLIALI